MDALRKMTIEPARRLERYAPVMNSKGRLSVGSDADITIFDVATDIDQATYADPNLPSAGIEYVLINGVVVDGGEFLPDIRHGRGIRTQ